MQLPTIFNNVLGPVTCGPSTSNTCGPCRIAFYTGKLLEGKLTKARVIFPQDSSYPTSYRGMRSDYAFANGFLGRLPDSNQLLESFTDLKEQGIEIAFEVSSDYSACEPMTSIHILENSEGKVLHTLGVSKGGGIFEIVEINGFQTSLNGDCHELLVFTNKVGSDNAQQIMDTVLKSISGVLSSSVTEKDGAYLINIKLQQELSISEVDTIAFQEGVCSIKTLPPLLPVVCLADAKPPFTNAKELLGYCKDRQKSVWEAAVDYECAVGGLTKEQVWENAQQILLVGDNAIDHGLHDKLDISGIVKPSARMLDDNFKSGKRFIPSGILGTASTWALAIMEYSNASGVVACIPTAGASGVVTGVLLAAAQEMQLSMDDKIKAFLTAGVVGLCMTEDNDFCGGEFGCQTEVGCASAMAAAGLAYYLGAMPKQILDAASVALQNMLGLICDPVAGLVQVPCFARNLSGVSNAVVSANAVMAGFDACIPLDETFQTMKDTGKLLPRELKGCGGGLCKTQKGKELESWYSEQKRQQA